MSVSERAREAIEVLCSLVFDVDSRSYDICLDMLSTIVDKGYILTPRNQLEWYVANKLAQRKVLRKRKIEPCGLGKPRTIFILNIDFIRTLYIMLQDAKAPPLCYQR